MATRDTADKAVCATLALVALALGGCIHYKARPISATKNAARLESRALTNLALKPLLETNLHREFHVWPPARWDLDMLMLAAFYYQPSLEIARAQWLEAQGGEVTAAQRPNPTLTLEPGYAYPTTAATPWIPLTMVDIPIETAGKRRLRRARAAYQAEAARLNVVATAWQVRGHAHSSLLDLHAADVRFDLLQRQVMLQEQLVERLDQQIQAGAIARSDAVLFRIALDRARLDLADARRQRAEARTHLSEAIGIPTAALEGVALDFGTGPNAASLAALTGAEFRRLALQSRADVLGALAKYAASESDLQFEIARQYPDVHLQPTYQYDEADNKWSLGIVFDLPLLNHNEGPIAEAGARRTEAAAQFNAVQASVLADIDRAVDGFRATQQSASALGSLAESESKRLESVREQVQAGAADQTDLLNTELEVLSAQLVQLDTQTKLLQAEATLETTLQHDLKFPKAVFQATQENANEK